MASTSQTSTKKGADIAGSACQRYNQQSAPLVVAISEYRRMLNDHTSTDDAITKRLEYIESLCRDIIRRELKAYVEKTD